MVKTDNQTVINNVIYVTLNIQVSDNVFTRATQLLARYSLWKDGWVAGWVSK